MSDATGDERLERIERGLDLLFATEVAKEILEAVDFEAILAAEPAEDPVDVDRLAAALGRPVGRVLAYRVLGRSGPAGFVGRTVGSRVGGRVFAETFRIAVERVDTGAVAGWLVDLDEETLPGPALREVLGPRLEDDVFALDPGGSVDDADAGGDAVGVHDAAGEDHTGALDGSDAAAGEDEGWTEIDVTGGAEGDAEEGTATDAEAEEDRDGTPDS